jgi:hypothetical protein
VEDIHDDIAMLVQQYAVSIDEHVNAIGRGRRQTPLEFDGDRLNFLLEPRWKCAAAHKLLLQSRRPLIFFGEPRGKVSFLLLSHFGSRSKKYAPLLKFGVLLVL